MKIHPKWQFNEMNQVGVDYTDISEVEAYDSRMTKLRNIPKEIEEIINLVGLTNDHVLLEYGTGTGEFAIAVAKHCSKVYAVDISSAMLDFAKQKAQNRGISNIEYCHAEFLTYQHSGEPLDVVVSQLALHHLPDFWKMIALIRIYSMLKKGGKFYLRDTVYSFDINNYEGYFDTWLNGIKQIAGEELAKDTEIAIRDEFSTYDWIMEELIRRAGFEIEKANYHQGFLAVYVCTKR
ncbi:MAG: class I SAM-dependent methyltransferase [Methanomicrobiales archaeon HGW-Methanomicrobiales-5]|nr:MAG: class I SAM-dependent methyltransferase [Methanomicrobiales archaeon HGW-Methanomicrobiales-5]